MDKETRDYRKNQFDRLTLESEYHTSIKLVSPDGETNYLKVTDDEVCAIRDLLTK